MHILLVHLLGACANKLLLPRARVHKLTTVVHRFCHTRDANRLRGGCTHRSVRLVRALQEAGRLPVRPVLRTSLPKCPAGAWSGNYLAMHSTWHANGMAQSADLSRACHIALAHCCRQGDVHPCQAGPACQEQYRHLCHFLAQRTVS
jgi:hypothetical protein